MSSVFRQLAKGVAVYGLGDGLVKSLALVTLPIYSRLFVPSEYGLLNLVRATNGVAGPISNLGFNSAVQRHYFDEERDDERTAIVSTGFWGLLGWSTTVCLLGISAATPLSEWLVGTPDHATLFVLAFAAVPVLQLVLYCQDVLRLHFAPWKYSGVSLANHASQFALTLAFVLLLGWGLAGFFAGSVIGAAIPALIAVFLIRSELRFAISGRRLRELAKFGYPLAFAGLAVPAFVFVDRIIIERFAGIETVGLLTAALFFPRLMIFIGAGFGRAWSPFVYKLRTTDPEYGKVVARVLLYLLIGFSFVAILFTAFARELLTVVVPPAYHPAAIAVGPLSIYAVANMSSHVTPFGISISRKTKYLALITWVGVTFNLVLDLALVPLFDLLGAAIASASSEVFITVALLYVSQKLHPLPYDYRRLVFVGVALVAFIASASYLQPESSIAGLSAKVGLVALFPATLLVLRVVERREIKRGAGLIKELALNVASPASLGLKKE